MPEQFANLPIADLAQGENVRFQLSEIEELAADIRRRGVLQPIVVIPNESGEGAEVLLGHRRLAAAKLAGLETIPCVLRKREIDVKRLLDQIAENTQRVQLTPIEEATACRALTEKGYTPGQIGVQMRKSDTWVTQRMKLLTLPQCLQDAVHVGKVVPTRALDLPRDAIASPEQIENLARHLNDEGLGAWWQEYYNMRLPIVRRESDPEPPPPKRPPGANFSLTMHFEPDTTKILDALVKASSVFTKKAEVVSALLEGQIEFVKDSMQWEGWELETLRYTDGMTDAEKEAYDAMQRAEVEARRQSDTQPT